MGPGHPGPVPHRRPRLAGRVQDLAAGQDRTAGAGSSRWDARPSPSPAAYAPALIPAVEGRPKPEDRAAPRPPKAMPMRITGSRRSVSAVRRSMRRDSRTARRAARGSPSSSALNATESATTASPAGAPRRIEAELGRTLGDEPVGAAEQRGDLAALTMASGHLHRMRPIGDVLDGETAPRSGQRHPQPQLPVEQPRSALVQPGARLLEGRAAGKDAVDGGHGGALQHLGDEDLAREHALREGRRRPADHDALRVDVDVARKDKTTPRMLIQERETASEDVPGPAIVVLQKGKVRSAPQADELRHRPHYRHWLAAPVDQAIIGGEHWTTASISPSCVSSSTNRRRSSCDWPSADSIASRRKSGWAWAGIPTSTVRGPATAATRAIPGAAPPAPRPRCPGPSGGRAPSDR